MKARRVELMFDLADTGAMTTIAGLYEEDSGLLYAIDEDNQNPKEAYVMILDMTKLIDRGVIDVSGEGVNQKKFVRKDDYVAVVVQDWNYDAMNRISRGTAWMKALNNYIKLIYNG